MHHWRHEHNIIMSILLDQAIDQWNALVGREEAYKVRPQQPSSPSRRQADGQPSPTHHSCPPAWREKICEWCFQVVDHCDIDRDVVAIALSYFDRYISLNESIAESLFQLVAMTSLYLAVKLHSTRKISISSMSSLSKGHFRVDQMLKMELLIIKTLRWRVNPPTSPVYLNIINPILDVSASQDQTSYEIVELSRYLLELSVCDGYFVDKSPSSIARAAILVAMENFSSSGKMKKKLDSYGLIDNSPEATELCTTRLRHVYNMVAQGREEEDGRAGSSPTSVFHQ